MQRNGGANAGPTPFRVALGVVGVSCGFFSPSAPERSMFPNVWESWGLSWFGHWQVWCRPNPKKKSGWSTISPRKNSNVGENEPVGFLLALIPVEILVVFFILFYVLDLLVFKRGDSSKFNHFGRQVTVPVL